MKNIIIIFFVLTFATYAQSNFDFEFDYAQFAYDSTSNYVEFYYSFNSSSLKLKDNDTLGTIEGLLKIFIQNLDNKDTIVNNRWSIIYNLDTSAQINQMIVGTLGFVIPGGVYECFVEGSDINNTSMSRKIKEVIKVIPFNTITLSISDIQLASKMVQDSQNTKSVFYKNTYEVIPIPNLVFGKSQPALFFYTELYNLMAADLKSDQLKMSQIIYNSRGKILKEKYKYVTRNSRTRVEVGSHVLSTFPTDTYTLLIALTDSAANIGVSSAKKFYVFNPDIQIPDSFEVTSTSVLSSAFGSMSEEELDDLFEKSKYISTRNEIDTFEKLSNTEGKRKFLYDFWKSKAEGSGSTESDFLRRYLQRVDFSNERYSAMGKEGWKTDRGRIYLLYGEPSEIERYPNQLDTRPYEIWYYNEIEGGIYFIFADITGFSDFALLTSTKRGELRDDNWQRRIQIR